MCIQCGCQDPRAFGPDTNQFAQRPARTCDHYHQFVLLLFVSRRLCCHAKPGFDACHFESFCLACFRRLLLISLSVCQLPHLLFRRELHAFGFVFSVEIDGCTDGYVLAADRHETGKFDVADEPFRGRRVG